MTLDTSPVRPIKLLWRMDLLLNFLSVLSDYCQGEDLIASFNAAYAANELSISQRREVVTLIPTEGRSLLELSNWRPITLLNKELRKATTAAATATSRNKSFNEQNNSCACAL